MRHNSPGNDCLLNLVTKFIQAKYAIAKQNKQIDAKKKRKKREQNKQIYYR